MTDTIALFSSSRNHGNTRKLLEDLRAQADIELRDLSNFNIADYDYDHGNMDDDFLPLVTDVLTYDKIIFASPVYWYSVTPRMKAFLDRISDLLDLPDLLDLGRKFREKKAYVVATSVSTDISQTFISSFKETFSYLGADYGGCLHANCVDGYSAKACEEDIRNFACLLD